MSDASPVDEQPRFWRWLFFGIGLVAVTVLLVEWFWPAAQSWVVGVVIPMFLLVKGIADSRRKKRRTGADGADPTEIRR